MKNRLRCKRFLKAIRITWLQKSCNLRMYVCYISFFLLSQNNFYNIFIIFFSNSIFFKELFSCIIKDINLIKNNSTYFEKDEIHTVDRYRTIVASLAHDEHPNRQLKSYWPDRSSELSLLLKLRCWRSSSHNILTSLRDDLVA